MRPAHQRGARAPQGARIGGIEVAFERPLWGSFGITSNVSRAKTRVDDGRPMVGASEWAGNLGGYFENDRLSARLVWNYRGKYVSSTTAPAPTANACGARASGPQMSFPAPRRTTETPTVTMMRLTVGAPMSGRRSRSSGSPPVLRRSPATSSRCRPTPPR